MSEETKRHVTYGIMFLALVSLILAVTAMISGCTTVPVTRQAWAPIVDSDGDVIVDAATGKPILTPLLNDSGNPVKTPVVDSDGIVKTTQVVDMGKAEAVVGTVTTIYPPSAPFAGLALGILGLFSRKDDV